MISIIEIIYRQTLFLNHLSGDVFHKYESFFIHSSHNFSCTLSVKRQKITIIPKIKEIIVI